MKITACVWIVVLSACSVPAQSAPQVTEERERPNLYEENRRLSAKAANHDAFPAEPAVERSTESEPKSPVSGHTRFFDKRNRALIAENVVAQTLALFSIQSHGRGLESRGRTLDPFEKHFESYGYGWGAVYRYGGGVGLNTFVTYMFHAGGHHKMERWVPVVAIGHAEASTGYALSGSRQGAGGW
jgi:hypothetical protein